MNNSKKVLKYAKEHFNEVHHTTLNPEGPGVVRIHLVPPALEDDNVGPSVVIINGQDIIPVNPSWTILLCEFIDEINKSDGKEVTEDDYKIIVNNICKKVKKIYTFLPKRVIKNDLNRILDTFTAVAYREDVTEEIGYMNIGEYAPFMKAPHRMDLLVSAMEKNGKWNCNQKCIHCYAAG